MPDDSASYIHIGCGFSAPEGWLNFDSSPTLRFERVPLIGRLYTRNPVRFPRAVRYGDIVAGLPVPDGRARGVYCSHVLEHIARNDLLVALANIHRLLAPAGLFRLVVPDLSWRVEQYQRSAAAGDAGAADRLMKSTCLGRYKRPRGLKARAVDFLSNAPHLWMYDSAALKQHLSGAGFTAVRDCEFGDCEDLMFARVEDEARFHDEGHKEVALEGRRPAA